MVFTTASVPLIGDRNLRRKEVTALLGAICSKTYPSFLTVKEGSTSHLGLLPSGKKRETALRCSDPLRSKVDGPSKVSPCCAGWDRRDASGNIFYVLDFGGVSEKSGVFRNIDVYKGGDVCDA